MKGNHQIKNKSKISHGEISHGDRCLGIPRCLFLYTDGLNEAENREQQQFGDDRLQQEIRQHQEEDALSMTEAVEKAVDGFVDGAEQSDDLTMLCIKMH